MQEYHGEYFDGMQIFQKTKRCLFGIDEKGRYYKSVIWDLDIESLMLS